MGGGETDSAIPEGIPPWRAVLFDGHSLSFAKVVEAMFERAIKPSCVTLAAELENTPRGHDDPSMDKWEDLRLAQLELHKSFALALNGLWERNFRQHLWHSAAAMGWKDRTLAAIESGPWAQLLKAFETVRGFPLSKFPTYPELELLHRVGNVARHGNGKGTLALHKTHPELFLEHDITSGWFAYFTLGGEPAHSIRRLYITLDQLEAFKDGIVGFWLMIRALQASDKD